jgi:hypothetical protein
MPQGRGYLPEETYFETVSLDEYGNEIVRITSLETNRTENGKHVARKTGRALMLVDGRLLLPHQVFGQKPIYLGVCRVCRNPPMRLWHQEVPTHGLCSLDRMKQCADCNVQTCPRHAKKSSYDQRYRCPACHQHHKFRCVLRRIFTEQVPREE